MQVDQRLDRLRRHALGGWQRIRAHSGDQARATRWLYEHPSDWPAVDRLWLEALEGRGALASWLDSGADPDLWTPGLPLHSVLASHPFACLSPWSTPGRSKQY
jgi:hypothetical protein